MGYETDATWAINIDVYWQGHAEFVSTPFYPTPIQAGTPFTITFSFKNTSASQDLMWCGLYNNLYPLGNIVTEVDIPGVTCNDDPGTWWEGNLASNGTIAITLNFAQGINAPISNYQIRIGHYEP